MALWYLPIAVSLLLQRTFTGWTGYAPLISGGSPGSSIVRFPKAFLVLPLLVAVLLAVKPKRIAVVVSSLVVLLLALSFLFAYHQSGPGPVGQRLASHLSFTMYFQLEYPDSTVAFVSILMSWLAAAGLGLAPFVRHKADET